TPLPGRLGRVKTLLVALLLATALAPSASGASPFSHLGPGCAPSDFASGGHGVRAELCRRGGEHAVVGVRHGCRGFDTTDCQLAARLPDYGFAKLYVDYFGPTP